jgi:[protein-PII] uridylyltransferase
MQPICDDFFEEVDEPAGSSSINLNPSVRAYLDAVREYLLALHDQGASPRRVDEEHSDLIDRLVRKLFRLSEDRYFESFPRLNFRLAVVATGGYGRRGLSLGSDVDLLFLHRGKVSSYVETLAEAISHRLWDARLSVGVATRTVQECMRLGQQDLPTLTSFLDARFLIGDPGLFAELSGEVQSWLRDHSSRFIRDKLEEQRRRHEAMGESLFLLQPNLRESVGGLRDYHTALWTARAVRWEVEVPEHLLLHDFIDAAELDALLAALEFLGRLRNELHRSGRKQDRLHFSSQEGLAESLGYQFKNDRLPVEQLMHEYYVHARAVQRVSRRVIDRAETLDRQRRGRPPEPARAVQEGFVIVDRKLEIPSPQLLEERPVRLFAAIVAGQQHGVELSSRAQRILEQHVYLIDDSFSVDPEAAELFRRILAAPERVYRSLTMMADLGLLGAYIPEFGEITALWQHDLYHTYTVDVHSLFLVEQLRRLIKGRFAEELPLATKLIREVPSPVTLFLSCMLHDIGKGRGGGHPEKAARMVPGISNRLNLTREEMETVRFLVYHHPTMSAMAEQRDVHDPRQILRLAHLVGTRAQLRNLYLLTVADIRSVSSEAWTTWKAGLLETLYRNTAEWLEAGAADETASRYFLDRALQTMVATRKEAIGKLSAAGMPEQEAIDFLDSMPRHYLFSHGPDEIAVHAQMVRSFVNSDDEIGVYLCPERDGEEVLSGLVVLARDQRGLASGVAGVLAGLGHDILTAEIYTNRASIAVDIYQVSVIPGGSAEKELERQRIQDRLTSVLRGEETVAALLLRRPRTQPRALRSQPPSVRIANDESDFYTVIDVTARDRVALLHDITRTLSESGLDIFMSRVSTRANRVTDTFYVTDEGHKLLDVGRRNEIQDALLEAIR